MLQRVSRMLATVKQNRKTSEKGLVCVSLLHLQPSLEHVVVFADGNMSTYALANVQKTTVQFLRKWI